MRDEVVVVYLDMPSTHLPFNARNSQIIRLMLNGETYVKDLTEEERREHRHAVHEEIVWRRNAMKLIDDMQDVIKRSQLEHFVSDLDERVQSLKSEG